MNKIVKILMERDGITEQEAQEMVQGTVNMMDECDYDPIECEDSSLSHWENIEKTIDYLKGCSTVFDYNILK